MDTPKVVPTNGNGSGAWDRTVDQAKSGAHSTIDRISDSARPAVDRLSSGAHQVVDKLSSAASQASSVLADKVGQAKDLHEQLLADARVRVREKPVTALAIAVAAGFLLRHLWRSR